MRIGVGIVGTGVVSHQHVAALRGASDAEIVAATDLDVSRCRHAAEAWGIAHCADLGQLLQRDDIQAVIVATPPAAHAEATIAALQAGKHVLCEKPLAASLDDARMIARAAEASTTSFVCGSSRLRCCPAHRQALQLAQDGELGEVYQVKYRLSMLRRRPGQHVLEEAPWFLDQSLAGGGALLDLGVYALDAALSLLGHPRIHTVTAQTYQFADTPGPAGVVHDVEDHALVMLQCEGAKSAVVEVAWMSNTAPGPTVEVLGTQSSLRLDPLTQIRAIGTGDAAQISEEQLLTDPESGPEGPETIRQLTREFVRGIREQSFPVTAAAEALVVQEVISAAYRSVREQVAVPFS
jgi:predicted dehydrogenase